MTKEIEKEVKLTDRVIDQMAKTAGEEINKQKKIRIRIPIDKLNPKDLIVPVCINGYLWQIERGKYVEVPEAVAEILVEAQYI